MKRVKQYLIQIKSGPLKGETAWTARKGNKFVRGTCVRLAIKNAEIEHAEDDVLVLGTRWYEDRTN